MTNLLHGKLFPATTLEAGMLSKSFSATIFSCFEKSGSVFDGNKLGEGQLCDGATPSHLESGLSFLVEVVRSVTIRVWCPIGCHPQMGSRTYMSFGLCYHILVFLSIDFCVKSLLLSK